MADEKYLDRIDSLLSIIKKQNERMDILSQRIDTANKRIDNIKDIIEAQQDAIIKLINKLNS